MPIGDIFCLKLTGELVTLLGYAPNGDFTVRRPVISHKDGISHQVETFTQLELETEEEHLQRDAQAMILKFKVQRQLQKEMDKLEEEEREANKPAGVNPGLLVN